MLEKMFPKAGCKQPEIRFKGFSGDWKENKLFKMVKPLISYPLSRDVETETFTGYRYIHYGDIHRGRVTIIEAEQELPNIKKHGFDILQRGDLVVADVSEDYVGIANPCVINCDLRDSVVAGLHTIAIRPIGLTPLFTYYVLQTHSFKSYARVIGTGTKVFGITTKNFLNFEYFFPCKNEQTQIGNYFKQLDDTLALQAQ